MMARGIDLSIPAVVSLSSTALLGFSSGREGALPAAIAAVPLLALSIGVANGISGRRLPAERIDCHTGRERDHIRRDIVALRFAAR